MGDPVPVPDPSLDDAYGSAPIDGGYGSASRPPRPARRARPAQPGRDGGAPPARPRARAQNERAPPGAREDTAERPPRRPRPVEGPAPRRARKGASGGAGPRDRSAREAGDGRAPGRPGGRAAAQDGADAWYRRKLARRIVALLACVALWLLLSYAAISTAAGQVLDTLLMEATMRATGRLVSFTSVVTGVVSVPAMVVAGVVVALVAVARKRPTLAGRALGMVIGANVTTQLLKDMISRPDLGMTTGISNSLPSGHSTVAVTLSLALVAIAPQWLRAPSAWIGWAWTSLMGVSVMMAGWHRPADVVVAVLIAGAWALALSPIERRARHGKRVSKVMLWAVLAAGALAFSLTLVGLWGFSMSAGAPGSGYGFNDFLSVRPWRSLVLGMGACAWIVAVVGAVVREVDLLADDSRSA